MSAPPTPVSQSVSQLIGPSSRHRHGKKKRTDEGLYFHSFIHSFVQGRPAPLRGGGGRWRCLFCPVCCMWGIWGGVA